MIPAVTRYTSVAIEFLVKVFAQESIPLYLTLISSSNVNIAFRYRSKIAGEITGTRGFSSSFFTAIGTVAVPLRSKVRSGTVTMQLLCPGLPPGTRVVHPITCTIKIKKKQRRYFVL